MNRKIFISLLILSFSVIVSASDSETVGDKARTDRYTLVSIAAEDRQLDPLTTISTYSLGREVATVGDAINEVLKGSGYQWSSANGDDQLLNSLLLPAVVRNMGPIRVSNALQTLVGEAWVMKVDRLNRTVWFERK